MSSILSPQFLHFSPHLNPKLHTQSHNQSFHHSPTLKSHLLSSSAVRRHAPLAAGTSPEGTVAVADFEDMMEKDWSFLSNLDSNYHTTQTVISSAEIGEKEEKESRVLVLVGSEVFIDKIIENSPSIELLVVHESLFTLACIKENHDKVNCWQGDLMFLPEKWIDFEVVFIYFLPALPFSIAEVLGTLAERCSPGARIVISHTQGREALEEQRKKYPDVIVSDLPDKDTIENAASNCSFKLLRFVDEPGFYLAVLKFKP